MIDRHVPKGDPITQPSVEVRLANLIGSMKFTPLPDLGAEMEVFNPRLLGYLLGNERRDFVADLPPEINLGPMGRHLRVVDEQRGTIIIDGREEVTEGELTFAFDPSTGRLGYSTSNDGKLGEVRPKHAANILFGRYPFLGSHTHLFVSLPTPYDDFRDIMIEDKNGKTRTTAEVVSCPGIQLLVLPSQHTPIIPRAEFERDRLVYTSKFDTIEDEVMSMMSGRLQWFQRIIESAEANDPDKSTSQSERLVSRLTQRYVDRSLPAHSDDYLDFIRRYHILIYGATDHTHFTRLDMDDLTEISMARLPKRFATPSSQQPPHL